MNSHVSVKDILVSLIESIDMYNFLLRDHHRRTAVIAYQLGNQCGLEHDQLSRLVLAASIHDIGALHIKERDQLLYVDAVDPGPHEELGAKMLAGFPPFAPIQQILRHHHIHHQDVVNGSISSDEVPMECYFVHLADRIDVLMTTSNEIESGHETIINEIQQRFGPVFLPALEPAFMQLADSDEFWDNIDNVSFHNLLMMSVEGEMCMVNRDDMDELAALFARVVDYKSPWTSNHSRSVSFLADEIGHLFGMSDERCHDLKIAGYLHDIGKIAIPSEILDKPGALNPMEFKIMKSHATYSSLILAKIPFLKSIAKWGSSHHEKRDRSGYPLHIGEREFSDEMDILAYADIFAALAEDRPYRDAMPKEKIMQILSGFADTQLSKPIFHTICDHVDDLYTMNQSLAYSAAN